MNNYTLSACINTYEKSNIRRLALALLSYFYNFEGISNADFKNISKLYYSFIKNSSTLDTALEDALNFFDNSKYFKLAKIQTDILSKITFILLIDGAERHDNPDDITHIAPASIFLQFVSKCHIPNYKIFLAKENYRVQVMRNVSFRNCDTDFMIWSDDDDLQGVSIFDRYRAFPKNMKNPREVAQRVSFLNILLLPENKPHKYFTSEISGMWGKMYSNKLCKYVYHIPSVSGGEDWITNRRIIGLLIKPHEEKYGKGFSEYEVSFYPRASYLWFPSNRNINISKLQNTISALHAKRNGFKFDSHTVEKGNITPKEIEQKLLKGIDKNKDKIYHEDEVIEVFYYDGLSDEIKTQNMFIAPRLTQYGVPHRKVKIEGNNIVITAEQDNMPSWVKPKMSIGYWNKHLKETPYISLL